MNLTEQQLKSLQEMSYLLIDIELIAVNLEVDELTLRDAISQKGSPEYIHYYRGYCLQLIELRQSLVRSAQNGSNPAQEQMLQFLARVTANMPK